MKVEKKSGDPVGPGNCPEGFREDCVTVSTGSLASKEDDVVKCTCIRN